MRQTKPKRALILMSHTGGGHRSVAKAIERGLLTIGGGEIAPVVVDLFALGRRSFVDNLVSLYSPIIVRSPSIWSLIYHAANGRRRFNGLVSLAEPLVRSKIKSLMADQSPEIVVSVHPLSNHLMTRTLSKMGLEVPVVTVLTDLVDVHAGWLSVDSELCIAPTPIAARALRAGGVRTDRILTLGLPIGPRFGAVEEEVEEVRAALGLSPRRLTVLVAGGSEGAGGIYRVVEAIVRSGLDVQLLVVCGRNESLRRRLEANQLVVSGRVFGYVDNMPALMHAADVVATKAGSLSIAEALAARRPVILFKALPGQEQGNVEFVRENGVGYAVSRPERIVGVLQRLVDNSDLRQRLAANTASVRRPEAAFEAARAIARLMGVRERETVATRLP